MNYDDPTNPTEEAGHAAAEGAAQAWETTKEKAGEALHTGERYVRENPGTSILSVFGFGFLVGMLVGWSMAHEDHSDYGDYADSTRKFLKRWGHKLNLD
jgi:hypothetical protein